MNVNVVWRAPVWWGASLSCPLDSLPPGGGGKPTPVDLPRGGGGGASCPGISCPPLWLSSPRGASCPGRFILPPAQHKKKYIHVILLFFCIILMNSDLRSAVGNVSGYRCVSDCRSRGREYDPGLVPYFRGDWSWNNFYGHSPPFRWFIQEGLLSVTSESMCTNYWLTACSSLSRKKCG